MRVVIYLQPPSWLRQKNEGKIYQKQIKVVGYDGTETGQILLPELTTIQQPISLIAQTAIDILLLKVKLMIYHWKSAFQLNF
ncbi:hypothetical protein GCM10020331_098350 [Ectobacillus funiculus]